MSIAIGKKLPAFSAESTGGPIQSAALAKNKLVLYFYPKDNTPGCTTEAREFAQALPRLTKAGATVIGVSRDSLASHKNFQSKFELNFALISDPDESLCALFGVIKNKKMYGRDVRGIERSTFLFDDAGKLVNAWRGVKVPGHVEQVVQAVEALESAKAN